MSDPLKAHSVAGEAIIAPLMDLGQVSSLLNTAEGAALAGSKCMHCSQLMIGTRVGCSSCMSSQIEAVALAREGVIYSWTMAHVVPGRSEPVCLAYVDLTDGVRTLAEIRVACEPAIGEEVVITADDDGQWWFASKMPAQERR